MGTAILAVAICAFGLEGCAAHDPSLPPNRNEAGSGLAIPCDPARVLVTVCQRCHSAPPQNSAPFPLVTYDDTHVVTYTITNGKPIWQTMQMAVESGLMPLVPVQISAEDRDALLTWLDAGAPARTASDTCSVVVAADAGDGDGAPESTAASSGAAEADAGLDACECGAVDDSDASPE